MGRSVVEIHRFNVLLSTNKKIKPVILLYMGNAVDERIHKLCSIFTKKKHCLHQVKVELPKIAEWVLKPEQSTENCHGKALNSLWQVALKSLGVLSLST